MPSIRDFSGGVVNQELLNRDNGAGILYDCKNVLSSWNGELRKRTGTDWLLNLYEESRVIPYRMPDGNDIMLVASNGGFLGYEFATDNTIVPVYTFSGTAPAFPTDDWDGNTTNGNWTISLSSTAAQSAWGKGFDTPIKTRPMRYYGKGSLWSGGYAQATNTPASIVIQNTNDVVFKSAVIRWTNTCNGNHPGHYKGWIEPYIQYSDDALEWTSVETICSIPEGFSGAGAYAQFNGHFGSGGSEQTENITLMQVTNKANVSKHKYWRIYFARRIENRQVYDGERIDMNISDVSFVSSTSTALNVTNAFFASEKINNIKYAQNDNLMILTNGVDKPLEISYASGTFTVQTHTNSLPDAQGRPACVCFYQNRLWFGGFTAFPTRVWGSSFGNFSDFTIPGTILATSPISVDSVEIQSVIENMWAGNNALYCLSEDGISMIDAAGGIVATDQIEFKLRNREPVNSMTPTYKNDIMIYLGRDKKKIFITDYDFVVQRFKAQNISLQYNDFFKSGIRELHYIPNKASLIYGILENGKAIVILFDPDRSKNSVYPLEIEGEIRDIQPVKFGNSTQLVMITQRDGAFYMERKKPQPDYDRMDFMSEEEQKNYTQEVLLSGLYTDFTVIKNYQLPTDTIEDLPFTASKPVYVIADGEILGFKDLLAPLSDTLYAWKTIDSVIYTDTESPTTSSVVYDESQQILTDYEIVDVDDDTIEVTHESRQTTKLCTRWEVTSSVTDTDGVTYNRNASLDGVYTYPRSGVRHYGFGFGSFISYRPNFSEMNANYIYTSAWIVQGQIASWSSTKYYVDGDQLPEVGANVYDESDSLVGTISEVGYTADEGYGFKYYYIVVNGQKIYSSIVTVGGIIQDDLYVVEKPIIVQSEIFTRDVTKDLLPRGTTLELDEPVSTVVMGYPYESYAVMKFSSPYNLRKFPKEASINLINSGYIELGNTFETLKPMLKNITESVSIDNKPILINGNYTKTFDKHSFETPYVIVYSKEALPFIITGIDYKIDTSNYQGGV